MKCTVRVNYRREHMEKMSHRQTSMSNTAPTAQDKLMMERCTGALLAQKAAESDLRRTLLAIASESRTCRVNHQLHEELVLKRIWKCSRGDLGGTNKLENCTRCQDADWKQLRAATAHITDLRNAQKMKRRGTGVFHTAMDKLFVKWTGKECWWKHITTDG